MLGVILEVGVETVRPRRADRVRQPGQLVVAEGQNLRQHPAPQPRTRGASGGQLLEDQQMPLLVVLLPAAHPNPVEHPPGKPWLAGRVGHRHICHVLPRLIGHPGDQLEHPKLLQGPLPAVDDIHHQEQCPGTETRVAARCASDASCSATSRSWSSRSIGPNGVRSTTRLDTGPATSIPPFYKRINHPTRCTAVLARPPGPERLRLNG